MMLGVPVLGAGFRFLGNGDKVMADRIGDIIADALPQLSARDRVAIQTTLNNMQRVADRVGGSVSQFDKIDAKSGRFAVLPHEAASMARDTIQTIPPGTYTTITFEPYADLFSYNQKYSFSNGIIATPSTGLFDVHNTVGSIMLFCGAVQWQANSTGLRELRLKTGSGTNTSISSVPAVTAAGTVNPFAIMRKMNRADESHYLQCWQNSGGNLEISFATFGILRVR